MAGGKAGGKFSARLSTTQRRARCVIACEHPACRGKRRDIRRDIRTDPEAETQQRSRLNAHQFKVKSSEGSVSSCFWLFRGVCIELFRASCFERAVSRELFRGSCFEGAVLSELFRASCLERAVSSCLEGAIGAVSSVSSLSFSMSVVSRRVLSRDVAIPRSSRWASTCVVGRRGVLPGWARMFVVFRVPAAA